MLLNVWCGISIDHSGIACVDCVACIDCRDGNRTELEPTFWEEPNRTRNHVEKTYIELEPNRTHQCDEPEPSNPGYGCVRQICEYLNSDVRLGFSGTRFQCLVLTFYISIQIALSDFEITEVQLNLKLSNNSRTPIKPN